jgi:N-acetylglutamate synthase-like GNAT family acetyltransferase
MYDILIRPFATKDLQHVVSLILSIQRQEFGIAITAEDQPDLGAIPSFYQSGAGGFWVADRGGDIVGTIGLKDIGNNDGALRKMFVAVSARGRAHGVAVMLLDALIDHAREKEMNSVYLGSTESFLAAHRFYEKNGFEQISKMALPSAFPIMRVDRKFYRRTLG